MRSYEIDSFTYEERDRVVPRLTRALAGAGACLVGCSSASAGGVEVVVELHPGAGLDMYCALAREGIELSRAGQQTLLAACDERSYAGGLTGIAGEMLSIRLVVRFLEAAPLATMLTRSSLIV